MRTKKSTEIVSFLLNKQAEFGIILTRYGGVRPRIKTLRGKQAAENRKFRIRRYTPRVSPARISHILKRWMRDEERNY
jgi:hypothetical protein